MSHPIATPVNPSQRLEALEVLGPGWPSGSCLVQLRTLALFPVPRIARRQRAPRMSPKTMQGLSPLIPSLKTFMLSSACPHPHPTRQLHSFDPETQEADDFLFLDISSWFLPTRHSLLSSFLSHSLPLPVLRIPKGYYGN